MSNLTLTNKIQTHNRRAAELAAAYQRKVSEMDALLAEVTALRAAMLKPTNLHWGHVGDLHLMTERLIATRAAMGGESEE